MKKILLIGLGMLTWLHADELRVYHIGNSLTASLTLDRVHGLFEQAGIDYQFGSQLSGGKSLIRHLNFKEEPDQKWVNWETMVPTAEGSFDPDPNPYDKRPGKRFGYYPEALSGHAWDAVVMQIYGDSLRDDVTAIRRFIEISLEHRTADTFYIYSTWPVRPVELDPESGERRALPIDYAKAWTTPYPFGAEDVDIRVARNTTPSRDFTDKLYKEISGFLEGKAGKVRLIPTGEVLFALDKKIREGALPGLEALARRDPARVPGWQAGATADAGINWLYADPIHLNPIPHKEGTLGIFVSGTTLFSVLSGRSPVGLSAAAYGLDDEKDLELIRAVQQTIWDVVSADPRCGVKPAAAVQP